MIRLKRNAELQRTIDQFVSGTKLTVKHYPMIGEIYLLLQQPERARSFLQKAMEVPPKDPSVYIHLSEIKDFCYAKRNC
jgi:hypothetical protein